ncbi:hypothetical protein RA19_24825, partial [Leisingera sp. ANG-M1]|uniref:3-hydroxyacyl-ACP dehydratase FabZ n=1 Tax=Leisingera sp. ANG-M1 TaxID=1577895 RepID=UPI00058089BB
MSSREIPITDILATIPHRYPFVMIDRVTECDGTKAVAIKNVTINEPFFVGHFPTEPIMPGMLIGEALAQTSAFIGSPRSQDGVEAEFASIGSKAFLTGITLKLSKPVVPGDQLVLTARLIKRLGQMMKVKAHARVGKDEVAAADI